MRLNLLFFVFSALFCATFFSCSRDDNEYVDRSNEENRVKIVVHSNTTDVPVRIEGFPLTEGWMVVKNHWEREIITKAYEAQLIVFCDDPSVLVTIEIYVNGKFVNRSEGNSRIVGGVDLKRNVRKYK